MDLPRNPQQSTGQQSLIGGGNVLKLKTASGMELDCDYMGHSDVHRQANVRILNATFPIVAAIFSNPSETGQLWFDGDYAAGFTKLLAIRDDGGAIWVVLGKE